MGWAGDSEPDPGPYRVPIASLSRPRRYGHTPLDLARGRACRTALDCVDTSDEDGVVDDELGAGGDSGAPSGARPRDRYRPQGQRCH